MISWHRFYDPTTGRYMTSDPIGLEGGINLYAYVGGDPVNFIDPEGLHTPSFYGEDFPHYHADQKDPENPNRKAATKWTDGFRHTVDYIIYYPSYYERSELSQFLIDYHEWLHIKHPYWTECEVLKAEYRYAKGLASRGVISNDLGYNLSDHLLDTEREMREWCDTCKETDKQYRVF